jgi:phosphoglycerol transferase
VLFHREAPGGRLRLDLTGRASVAAVVVCLLVSVAGVYYTAFTGVFLLTAGAAAARARRRLYPLGNAAALCGLMGLSLAVNLAPSWLSAWERGPNRQGFRRTPSEAETYGLRPSHLLFPGEDHRLASVHPFFARGVSRWGVYLGLVGGVGFVALLGRLLLRGRGTGERSTLLNFLALLTGCGVLVATVDGFGYVFGQLATPAVRWYYRMAVFLAFFALTTVAVGLDRLGRRLGPSPWRRAAFCGLLAGILIFGLVDQVPRPVFRDEDFYARRFRDDAAFVGAIEASLPPGAMVFQLPYSPFPEPEPWWPGLPYELLRPYLHSRTLRWSYGAYKGRTWDRWQRRTVEKTVKDMVRELAVAGFQGIYLDRSCYRDHGYVIEALLTPATGVQPWCSPDGDRLFYPLADYLAHPETDPDELTCVAASP